MAAIKELKNCSFITMKTVSALTPVKMSPSTTRPTRPEATAKNREKITHTMAMRVACGISLAEVMLIKRTRM